MLESGRAGASSYPGPHVWSRGPQLLLLLPLLMFLTCSVPRSEDREGVGRGGERLACRLLAPSQFEAAWQVTSVCKSPRVKIGCSLCKQRKTESYFNTETFTLDVCEITCKHSGENILFSCSLCIYYIFCIKLWMAHTFVFCEKTKPSCKWSCCKMQNPNHIWVNFSTHA